MWPVLKLLNTLYLNYIHILIFILSRWKATLKCHKLKIFKGLCNTKIG